MTMTDTEQIEKITEAIAARGDTADVGSLALAIDGRGLSLVLKYSDDQPRDEQGRWSGGGGSSGGGGGVGKETSRVRREIADTHARMDKITADFETNNAKLQKELADTDDDLQARGIIEGIKGNRAKFDREYGREIETLAKLEDEDLVTATMKDRVSELEDKLKNQNAAADRAEERLNRLRSIKPADGASIHRSATGPSGNPPADSEYWDKREPRASGTTGEGRERSDKYGATADSLAEDMNFLLRPTEARTPANAEEHDMRVEFGRNALASDVNFRESAAAYALADRAATVAMNEGRSEQTQLAARAAAAERYKEMLRSAKGIMGKVNDTWERRQKRGAKYRIPGTGNPDHWT